MLLCDFFLKIVKMWVSPLVHDAINMSSCKLNILSSEVDMSRYKLNILSSELKISSFELNILSCEVNISIS